MGIMETMMSALADSLKKGIGRKNLVAIVAMCLLAAVPDLPFMVCVLITVIACVAVGTQWCLDLYEVKASGHDTPDNGDEGPEEPAIGLTHQAENAVETPPAIDVPPEK